MTVEEQIKDRALELGFSLVGIARAQEPPHYGAYLSWIAQQRHGTMSYLARHSALKKHPNQLLEGARSVIAVALNYNQPNPHQPEQPRIARYALGRDYHHVLRSKLKLLAASLDPNHSHRACVDSAPVMERDFANLAGLGWFGKNTMLINSQRGSWFFIGLLLTTMLLEPDEPALGGCGTCQRCVEACPTGAIIHEDGRWQIEARRCISYLTIEHKGMPDERIGDWTFGCDICQEVCPFNEPRESQPLRAQTTHEPDFLQKRQWPSLLELTQISDARWDELTRGSPVRRAGRERIQAAARISLMAK